jgi:hypothetical protein
MSTVPPHLVSTYELVRRAYGPVIPDEAVLPVMRVLYDHLSDRNLADMFEALLPGARSSWLNEVLRAAQLGLEDPGVLAAFARLRASGVDAWADEP